jgi:molecular chaperone GrpE
MEEDAPDENKLKTDDIERQLESEKKRSEEYLLRLQYLQADFDNLKKRFDRQIEQVRSYSNERLLIQLLEVADELELAVETAQTTNQAEALVQGVQMTLKRLRKVLEQEGVFEIECERKPFDPSKHNAIATVECSDVDGCLVVEEVRKGYIMKDKVLRPSIVKVSTKPSSKSQNMEENKK